MASQTVAGDAASVPATISAQAVGIFTNARAAALDHAGREILALAQAARVACQPGARVDEIHILMGSVLKRVELLGSCVGVLAGCESDDEEIAAQFRLVFGCGPEARHV